MQIWNPSFNLFLDKKFVDEYSLLFEETQVQAKSYLEKQTVLKEMSKILNVKPFFIDDEIFKKLNEKYIFKDYSLKRVRDIELNKMQLIEAYIYSKNPIIKQRLINMFSEGGYDRIMSLLNSDDIKIGDLLQRTAEKYYKPVNQVYIKKYGIDMPKAKIISRLRLMLYKNWIYLISTQNKAQRQSSLKPAHQACLCL